MAILFALDDKLFISHTTAYKLLQSGEIKAFKLGTWKIPSKSVEEYIKSKVKSSSWQDLIQQIYYRKQADYSLLLFKARPRSKRHAPPMITCCGWLRIPMFAIPSNSCGREKSTIFNASERPSAKSADISIAKTTTASTPPSIKNNFLPAAYIGSGHFCIFFSPPPYIIPQRWFFWKKYLGNWSSSAFWLPKGWDCFPLIWPGIFPGFIKPWISRPWRHPVGSFPLLGGFFMPLWALPPPWFQPPVLPMKIKSERLPSMVCSFYLIFLGASFSFDLNYIGFPWQLF